MSLCITGCVTTSNFRVITAISSGVRTDDSSHEGVLPFVDVFPFFTVVFPFASVSPVAGAFSVAGVFSVAGAFPVADVSSCAGMPTNGVVLCFWGRDCSRN